MKHSNHPTTNADANNNTPETKPAYGEVTKKAYALYEKEGRPQGRDKQNWLEADVQSQHAGFGPSHPLGNHQHQSGGSVGAV